MVLAGYLRGLVSTNKRRYTNGKYDLDLSYIEDRIIAMGYPSEGMRSLIRNPLKQAAQFLTEHHGNHVKCYNLCIEKGWQYAHHKLGGAVVVECPLYDGQAPPLHVMHAFCEDATAWLRQHPENVVAVHCKAGKGRTGALICALLLYLAKHEPSMVPGFLSSNQGSLEPAFAGALTNIHASAHRTNLPASMPASGTTSSNQPKALLLQQQQQSDHQQVQDPAATHDSSHTQHHRASHTGTGSAHKIALAGHALTFYGHQRTYDGHGLTISSQRRYVSYYAHLLACGLKAPPAQRVRVVQLRLVGLPPWLTQKAPGCTVAVWTRAPGSVESQLLACTHVGPNTPAAAAAASSTDCRRTEAQPQAGCLSQPSPHTRSAVADTSEGASGAAAKQGGLAGEAAPHQAGVAGERLPCIMLPRVLRVDGTVELSLAPFSAPSSSSTVISPGSIPAGKAQINSVGQDQQSCGIQGSGVEVAGDVKIQVFKGRVWPHSAAVFSGRSSMFLAWLNVGFLGEHMEHARHAVRPGAPPCGTTSEQEPGADAVKPEKSGASSGDAGAAAKPEDGAQIELRGSSVAPSLQTCQSGQTGQSGGLRAVVVHGGELDKVHKKLRRSCWAALRLEVVYAPLG